MKTLQRRRILSTHVKCLLQCFVTISLFPTIIRNLFVDSFQPSNVNNQRIRRVNFSRQFARDAKSGKKFIQNEPRSDAVASVGDVYVKKRKKMKKRVSCTPSPVSDEELAHHVSSMYSNGSSGVMSQLAKKRERIEMCSKESHNDDDENQQYLKKLDRHLTLVLNADYQPLSVLPLSMWTWQETIKSVFSGKVTVVEVYSDVSIRAVNMDVPLPSVIALNEFCPQPHQTPAFTRRNVFLRDGYRCQYCYKRYRFQDLSLDHLHPRCMGGQLKW